jgi:hypothetical protein
VESRLNPRSPTVHTWFHVLSRRTGRDTIREMPDKTLRRRGTASRAAMSDGEDVMKCGKKYRCTARIAGIVLGLLITADPALADDLGNPGVIPPDSNEFGNPYGEWSARWWQWLLSIPEATNPNLTTGNVHCELGQSGQVWFLAGTFGGPAVTRSCILPIPAGKDLLVTPLNGVFGELGPQVGDCSPNQCDINALRASAAANVDNPPPLVVTIDDHPVMHVDQYRATSPVFDVTFPKGAIFNIPPGLHGPLVSDGYWLLLRPLSPGMHRIFSNGVTYNLTVQN